MITVIHGDDTIASRNFFLLEKQKYKNSILQDSKNLELSDLLQILESKNLFFEEKSIFIENFFSSKQLLSSKETIQAMENLKTDIFLYDSSELSKTQLAVFKNPRIKLFKLPQELFIFLDNIRPKNSQNVVYFHNALKNSTEDMIFYMVIRQFRLLLALLGSGVGNIDEVKRLAPWQRSKLSSQARLFSEESLKSIYKKLFEIDLAYKSGQITTITPSIDFLLLGI